MVWLGNTSIGTLIVQDAANDLLYQSAEDSFALKQHDGSTITDAESVALAESELAVPIAENAQVHWLGKHNAALESAQSAATQGRFLRVLKATTKARVYLQNALVYVDNDARDESLLASRERITDVVALACKNAFKQLVTTNIGAFRRALGSTIKPETPLPKSSRKAIAVLEQCPGVESTLSPNEEARARKRVCSKLAETEVRAAIVNAKRGMLGNLQSIVLDKQFYIDGGCDEYNTPKNLKRAETTLRRACTNEASQTLDALNATLASPAYKEDPTQPTAKDHFDALQRCAQQYPDEAPPDLSERVQQSQRSFVEREGQRARIETP